MLSLQNTTQASSGVSSAALWTSAAVRAPASKTASRRSHVPITWHCIRAATISWPVCAIWTLYAIVPHRCMPIRLPTRWPSALEDSLAIPVWMVTITNTASLTDIRSIDGFRICSRNRHWTLKWRHGHNKSTQSTHGWIPIDTLTCGRVQRGWQSLLEIRGHHFDWHQMRIAMSVYVYISSWISLPTFFVNSWWENL